jgi:hypothetical protein
VEQAKRDEEHYMLRIAVTYLVTTVLPTVTSQSSKTGVTSVEDSAPMPPASTSSFRAKARSATNDPLPAVVEERLRSLQRMERAWGSAWIARGSSSGGLWLSERTRVKERQAFRDALRDGVVLC